MNIVLPSPTEMPSRLFDMMLQRFQSELVHGFTDNSAALEYWYREDLETRSVLRASFHFSYDTVVEEEHLSRVMNTLKTTVEKSGWHANVHGSHLDICEVDFKSLINSRDPDDSFDLRDDDSDNGFVSLSRDGELESDDPESVDFEFEEFAEASDDGGETPLEFEEDTIELVSTVDLAELTSKIKAFEEFVTTVPEMLTADISFVSGTHAVVTVNGFSIDVVAKTDYPLGKAIVVLETKDREGRVVQFVHPRSVVKFFTEEYGNDAK